MRWESGRRSDNVEDRRGRRVTRGLAGGGLGALVLIDLEEALTAAAAIGDDRLQGQSQGYVVPESFTHGTSEQRVRWFREGFRTGDSARCDTFRADAL